MSQVHPCARTTPRTRAEQTRLGCGARRARHQQSGSEGRGAVQSAGEHRRRKKIRCAGRIREAGVAFHEGPRTPRCLTSSFAA